MRSLVYYINRWTLTQVPYLIKNFLSAICILTLTCFAVQSNAFEEYGATKTCLFAILMCNVWSGVFNSIAMFYSESDYLFDDLKKFLSVKVYIASNFLIQIFLCLIEALASAVIFDIFYNYDNKGIVFENSNIEYVITFFLILYSADMLGFLVGMTIRNITSAMSIIPAILIVQFLFSGCLFELKGILNKFASFTTAKWGFSALGSIANLNQYLPYGPEDLLFKYDVTHIFFCWKQLSLICVVCLIGAGEILYIRVNKQNN